MSGAMTYAEYRRLRKGGPGSGHFDHAGRPGQRGGSLPDVVEGHSTDNIQVRNRHTYSGPGDYMGRGTIFGNKAGVKKYPGVEVVVDSVDEAIKWYADWLRDQYRQKGKVYDALMKYAQKFLRGEKINLICSCAPKPCHCDVIKSAIIGIAKRIAKKR